MSTPIESQSDLTIGQVEAVSPSEIRVAIDAAAPRSIALNTGLPAPFPRINGYVLIPNESGATIGLISWVGLARAPLPRGFAKDQSLIDLPYPERVMDVVPVATLSTKRKGSGSQTYELRRGVSAYPSVGDNVILPTHSQLLAIVGSQGENNRVHIGSSPIAGDTEISVDPDKLFGRHIAVLGNTGSGKSCSVAGLIRWSLESAAAPAKSAAEKGRRPSARFIVLDPNGEYSNTFKDLGHVELFKVPPLQSDSDANALAVPAWLWNSEEWAAFAHAQPGAQRPLLVQSLRDLRATSRVRAPAEAKALRICHSYRTRLEALLGGPVTGYQGSTPAKMSTGQLLDAMATDLRTLSEQLSGKQAAAASEAADKVSHLADSRRSGKWFNDFSMTDLEAGVQALNGLIRELPPLTDPATVSEDAPLPFDASDLPGHLESLAAEQGGNAATFVATLSMRIRTMLADRRLGPVVSPDKQVKFEDWLTSMVGGTDHGEGQVTVVDLSLVPTDVVHVVVAVIARIVFEALQRHRRLFDSSLPTVLVLEEAHTFIRKGAQDEDPGAISPAHMCRRVFERIAREGRKFGLGLVLSSQRPSELSPTALAQCNTFLLHRLVNDRDQELVRRLVPDNLGGLLKELPSLPSGEAILLGWATAIPLLVQLRRLPQEQQPRSTDPEFWEAWTGTVDRNPDWPAVVADWLR